MPHWDQIQGSPSPLGATWIVEDRAFNFAIYSKHAERVTLLFFGDDLASPLFRFEFDPLNNKSDSIWHARIAYDDVADALYFAYQIEGPVPGQGYELHSFDHEKLLLDPYAKNIFLPPQFDRSAACRPGSNLEKAPLSSLPSVTTYVQWDGDRPVRHDADLIVYELHVKGLTYHPSSGVSADRRGKFSGIVEKIPYLKELGVTAVELMPVFQFDPQEDNYWGYMPLNFFAPHNLYCEGAAPAEHHLEFASMVRELHRADIEVWLDVVFNHTCEGDEDGPTYCMKGIDNSTYYLLTGDPQHPYANFSGTGNTLHTQNRVVRELILDSLRYWVKEMHIDGFRFDLASIFTRNSDGTINTGDPPIFGQIAGDPDLENVRLIAEPWDSAGAYQLGRTFPGILWKQWNGAYRDTLQRFLRGDEGQVGDLMTRLYGSDDLFPDDPHTALHPFQSINYVSSHDGSTLYDLVSFNEKNNWANGHENLDGQTEFRWNCGWEGNEDVPTDVMELRMRQVKNFCSLLMLSNGVPMFRMGDEFLNSQEGNNNPYNQDNETSWLNWEQLPAQRDHVFRFFREMIRFRKRHPSLSRSRFWREDVQWHGVGLYPDLGWNSHALAFCLRGASQNDCDLYVIINAWWNPLEFGIYEGTAAEWKRVIDTSLAPPEDIVEEAEAPALKKSSYQLQGRSVVVLVRQ